MTAVKLLTSKIAFKNPHLCPPAYHNSNMIDHEPLADTMSAARRQTGCCDGQDVLSAANDMNGIFAAMRRPSPGRRLRPSPFFWYFSLNEQRKVQ